MSSDQRIPEPILASWKISEVLRRYPLLLDLLVDLTPAFAKLRNPLMRRVQARLVTVAQAAGIAGLDPAVLTRQLNQAAGITPPDGDASPAATGTRQTSTPPAWTDFAPLAETLDVRSMMDRGEEPFQSIMSAARLVPVGAVLRLKVGFEPLPLYDALGKQGFTHWAQQVVPGQWQADFLREHPAGALEGRKATAAVDWNAPVSGEVTIDVSELVPPEPMVRVLQTLETLPVDGRLLVHHVRRPIHLYDRLNEMGYAHETRELAPDHVEVLIQKRRSSKQPL